MIPMAWTGQDAGGWNTSGNASAMEAFQTNEDDLAKRRILPFLTISRVRLTPIRMFGSMKAGMNLSFNPQKEWDLRAPEWRREAARREDSVIWRGQGASVGTQEPPHKFTADSLFRCETSLAFVSPSPRQSPGLGR